MCRLSISLLYGYSIIVGAGRILIDYIVVCDELTVGHIKYTIIFCKYILLMGGEYLQKYFIVFIFQPLVIHFCYLHVNSNIMCGIPCFVLILF